MYFKFLGYFSPPSSLKHVVFISTELLIVVSFLICLFRMVMTIYEVIGWEAG